MVDYIKIKIKAGKGGDGAVSFARLRGRSFGPPDGGDGGAGGDVYLAVNKDLNTLLPYRFKKNFQAAAGERGGKNHKKGAVGSSLLLPMPPGTRVSDEAGRLVADLTKVGEKVMVAKGGQGGRGNAHIKKSEVKSQKSKVGKEIWSWHEKGGEGQEIALTLELKLLADVGLIGLPNAGKSTLLAKLTAAHPKIAPYPFTTLEPNLGVMSYPTAPRLRGAGKGKELVLADIPGLIEGASEGKGLGDLFLRHVERTKILVHLVSVEVEDPLEALLVINKELESYARSLADKTQVILLTKIDIVSKEDLKNKVDQFKKRHIKVIPISAMSEAGLELLKDELIRKF